MGDLCTRTERWHVILNLFRVINLASLGAQSIYCSGDLLISVVRTIRVVWDVADLIKFGKTMKRLHKWFGLRKVWLGILLQGKDRAMSKWGDLARINLRNQRAEPRGCSCVFLPHYSIRMSLLGTGETVSHVYFEATLSGRNESFSLLVRNCLIYILENL